MKYTRRILSPLWLLGVLISANVAAAAPDVLPTAIPHDPAQQEALTKTLSAKAADVRTLEEWKRLTLLRITRVSDVPSDAAARQEVEQVVAVARAKFPNDIELLAMEGTVTCMKAGTPGIDGMTAMTLARQGFRTLDRAVERDQAILGARLQRAISSLRAPRFLGKTETAQKDFEYILGRVPASADNAVTGLRAMVLYHLGEALDQSGQAARAKEFWQESAKLNVVVWSARARAKL